MIINFFTLHNIHVCITKQKILQKLEMEIFIINGNTLYIFVLFNYTSTKSTNKFKCRFYPLWLCQKIVSILLLLIHMKMLLFIQLFILLRRSYFFKMLIFLTILCLLKVLIVLSVLCILILLVALMFVDVIFLQWIPQKFVLQLNS